VSALREIAGPFVAAPPAGARVRTRLRVSAADAAVLGEAGGYLGSLASADLAARCAEGRLDARQGARSRQVRKRDLTAKSSSRWAGALTRASEDACQLGCRNLLAERRSLLARINRIETRLAVPAGERTGRIRGYPSPAERHAKTVRVQALRTRLAGVGRQLDTGRVSVCRGGKALLRKRHNLADAGLTEAQWRAQWESARMFLTADGEKDKAWGNETIRWNPGEGWLEIKLPAPLAGLANRPHGRFRLSCPVEFTYRGDEVAAQCAAGAIRYDISFDPDRGRWYLDASWNTAAPLAVSLDDLREHPVVAVDVNAGHLAVAVVAADGNIIGTPVTVPLDMAGLPAATRDGRLRAAVSGLIATARRHGARAVAVEDLNFAAARDEGRERHGSRPSRGGRGRAFRRAVAGIPAGKFRDRLVQMTASAGLHVIVADPAYTSRWGAEHWLAPLRQHHPRLTGHHAAALVIGRRGLGFRARRRASGNLPAPADAARSTQARPGTCPQAGTRTRRPATRTDPRQPPGSKTGKPRRTPGGRPGDPGPSGAARQAGLTPAR
jgi:hypothetical protein